MLHEHENNSEETRILLKIPATFSPSDPFRPCSSSLCHGKRHSEMSILDTFIYPVLFSLDCLQKTSFTSRPAIYIDRKAIKMEMMPSRRASQKREKCWKQFMAFHFLWCCRFSPLPSSTARWNIPLIQFSLPLTTDASLPFPPTTTSYSFLLRLQFQFR